MWCDELLSEPPVRRDENNLVFDARGSAEWLKRQNDSVERYVDESYEEDPTQGQMFGNFIATGIERDEAILDIGCGLFPDLPHYVAQLGLKRYLGLEPLTTPVARSYPCLVGVVAEHIPLKDATIDAVLFATSLDHIEAEDAAMQEVKRVLKPGGKIFLWQGLHDPLMLARKKTFEPIFGGKLTFKRAFRLAFAPVEYAHLGYRMAKKRRQLATGADIDGIHFRYYTRAMLDASLERWGLTKTRELMPPAMPSIFVEVHT